jgi:hypothetical protein
MCGLWTVACGYGAVSQLGALNLRKQLLILADLDNCSTSPQELEVHTKLGIIRFGLLVISKVSSRFFDSCGGCVALSCWAGLQGMFQNINKYIEI